MQQLAEQAALSKPDCHPVLLFLHCSAQPPLYHLMVLNGPPLYWWGLWPCFLRPGVQIWISIKGSLRYHCHLCRAVGRLVWLKGPIISLWQIAKTSFSLPLGVTLLICTYMHGGIFRRGIRLLWWIWSVWPSPEPSTHLTFLRKWQLSHRKLTLSLLKKAHHIGGDIEGDVIWHILWHWHKNLLFDLKVYIFW